MQTNNYVDFHNHMLHAIDDGPRTLNEAVMLARAMVTAGYSTVVVTPHSCEGKPAPALILERLADLQAELDRIEIPLKLLPGAEQHIEPLTLERLQHGEILTLNQTRYLLLELPMLQPLPPYTEQLLHSLVTHGYQPIIPHPERVIVLQQDLQLIYRLYEAGALFQVTWGALAGWLGPDALKIALAMLAANLAHFFSTDAHNAASRLLTLDKATAILEEIEGPGSAELYLVTRPGQLLANQDLDLPAPKPFEQPATRKNFIDYFRRA
jgi:protein-tyrosine phosphatase